MKISSITYTVIKKWPSLEKFEYQFLTDTWEGVAGAAYNETYKFCKEFGWCDQEGKPTPTGYKAIQEYEESKVIR